MIDPWRRKLPDEPERLLVVTCGAWLRFSYLCQLISIAWYYIYMTSYIRWKKRFRKMDGGKRVLLVFSVEWHKPKNSACIHRRSRSHTPQPNTSCVDTFILSATFFNTRNAAMRNNSLSRCSFIFQDATKKTWDVETEVQRVTAVEMRRVWSSGFQSSTNWCIASCWKCQFNRNLWSERVFHCELFLTLIFFLNK